MVVAAVVVARVFGVFRPKTTQISDHWPGNRGRPGDPETPPPLPLGPGLLEPYQPWMYISSSVLRHLLVLSGRAKKSPLEPCQLTARCVAEQVLLK
eukprot:gene6510-biopygen13712